MYAKTDTEGVVRRSDSLQANHPRLYDLSITLKDVRFAAIWPE